MSSGVRRNIKPIRTNVTKEECKAFMLLSCSFCFKIKRHVWTRALFCFFFLQYQLRSELTLACIQQLGNISSPHIYFLSFFLSMNMALNGRLKVYCSHLFSYYYFLFYFTFFTLLLLFTFLINFVMVELFLCFSSVAVTIYHILSFLFIGCWQPNALSFFVNYCYISMLLILF